MWSNRAMETLSEGKHRRPLRALDAASEADTFTAQLKQLNHGLKELSHKFKNLQEKPRYRTQPITASLQRKSHLATTSIAPSTTHTQSLGQQPPPPPGPTTASKGKTLPLCHEKSVGTEEGEVESEGVSILRQILLDTNFIPDTAARNILRSYRKIFIRLLGAEDVKKVERRISYRLGQTKISDTHTTRTSTTQKQQTPSETDSKTVTTPSHSSKDKKKLIPTDDSQTVTTTPSQSSKDQQQLRPTDDYPSATPTTPRSSNDQQKPRPTDCPDENHRDSHTKLPKQAKANLQDESGSGKKKTKAPLPQVGTAATRQGDAVISNNKQKTTNNSLIVSNRRKQPAAKRPARPVKERDLTRGFAIQVYPKRTFLKQEADIKERINKNGGTKIAHLHVPYPRKFHDRNAHGETPDADNEEVEVSLEDDLAEVESSNIETFDYNGVPQFKHNPELLSDLSADSDMNNLSDIQKAVENCWRAEWLTSKSEEATVNERGEPVHFAAFSLPIVYEAGRTGFQESKHFEPPMGSVVAGRYRVLEFLGSAAFSIALGCKDLLSGKKMCLKVVKNNKDFFDQSIDEIKVLRYLNRMGDSDANNIVRLNEHFYYKEHLFICTELLKENLYDVQQYIQLNKCPVFFTLARIQRICIQILHALKFVHDHGLIHTDLKPENVLVKSFSQCNVKLIDFGSSCFVSDRLSSYIQSRSYRAPEVTLGLAYGPKIDIWSLGCVLSELYTGEVLFLNEAIQFSLARMQSWLDGFPEWMLRNAPFRDKYFTKRGEAFLHDSQRDNTLVLKPCPQSLKEKLNCQDAEFIDFLKYLLQVDVTKRPTAHEALQHPWLAVQYEWETYSFKHSK